MNAFRSSVFVCRTTPLVLLCILIFFSSFGVARAHGSGSSFEKVVGAYLVDVGYDPASLEVDSTVRFDFTLRGATSSEEIQFSDVWVRIEKEKKTVFASGIHRSEFGKTGLLYTFGEPGTYTIYARFQNNEDTIVETSFPLDVSGASSLEGKSWAPDKSVLWGVFGLIVGVVLSFVIKRKVNNV